MNMEKNVLSFGEEHTKNKLHIYERSVSIDKVNTKRIVLSKKVLYSTGLCKCFIGYIYIYIYIYKYIDR